MNTATLPQQEEISSLTLSRQLDELHGKHGFGNSRLLKVRNYLTFLKEAAPEAIWQHSASIEEDMLREVWSIQHGNYGYVMMVVSHRAHRSPVCSVKNPDTPRAVQNMLTHMQRTIMPENKDAATRIFNTVFNSHSTDCVYSVDVDDQEWNMMLHDNRNHTHATIEVYRSR